MGLEGGWYGYIKHQPCSPVASYRIQSCLNKINHLAEQQINDLAHALDA